MRILAAVLTLALVWAGQVMPTHAAPALTPLTVETASGAHNFQVEVVDTDESRAQGLMYRRELAADRGMLFDFKEQKPVSFWMQNTYISLDIVFIHSDGTVQRVEERATPLSTRTIESGDAVQFVLEVPAGTAAKLGIKRGSRVKHRLIGG
jgi:uncharacterized membrane protein (UPF0127 family)